jgi:hypothetical protein
MKLLVPMAAVAVLALAGCGTGAATHEEEGGPVAAGSPTSPQEAFWANLQLHCGNAYRGGLVLEPPGDDMLTGTEELVVHFRECGQDTLRLPFHIEVEGTDQWDRSRTWMFMRTARGLELRHDHRQQDGSPDSQTMYGAFTQDEGSPNTQEFIITDRTAQDGSLLGWRVEVEPNQRYTYGTIRGGQWTWRVDFDLSQPVAPPPAPWGY